MKSIQKITALILLASFCLVGCWDQEEITALAPVSGIGVDVGSEPGMLRISIQISLPGISMGDAGGGGFSRLRVLSVEAESFMSAFVLLQSSSRRKIFLHHLGFIVFGADLAKEGIADATEAVLSWPQIRGSTFMFVAQGTAEQVLLAHSGIGGNPGGDIIDIISKVQTIPVARKMTLNDTANALLQPGSTTLTLPILGLIPLALHSGDETPPAGVGQDGEQYMEIILDGTALFNRDRWVTELSVRETQTFTILIGAAKGGASTIPSPVNKEGVIVPEYEKIQIKHKIEQSADGQLQITVSPILKVHLLEIQGGYDMEQEGHGPIEAAIVADARTRVLELIVKLQELELDSLDIGQMIKRKNPKLWREIEQEWAQIYPTVEFRSEPTAKVRTTGLLKTYNQLGK